MGERHDPTARQQHHLSSWGYSHQSGTEVLPTHGPSASRCSGLLWLNVLFTGNRVWRHLEHFICHILLWLLNDRGPRVRFCWVPSHCGIEGNERMDQLAKETLDQDKASLASVHHTDLNPLVNSYIQQLVKTKLDVAVHGRDLYLVNPTLGQPKKFQHLTRAEKVVITRLRIGHTKTPSPISWSEDHRLLITTVVTYWALTICSWSVQYYRHVVTNNTQLTH